MIKIDHDADPAARPRTVVTTREARAADWGSPVLFVLIVSASLAISVLSLFWMLN